MYLIAYREDRDPVWAYDLGARRCLFGPPGTVELSGDALQVDGAPHVLSPTGRPGVFAAQGETDSFSVFVAESWNSYQQSLFELPRLADPDAARAAVSDRLDAFYVMSPSQVVDGSLAPYLSDSPVFDVAAHLRESRYLSEEFGLALIRDAEVFAPNLVIRRNGSFLREPLAMARWTTVACGDAVHVPRLNGVFHATGPARRYGGAVLVLGPMNYGHWFAQNLPAVFALKRAVAEGLVALGEAAIAVSSPANHPLLRAYLDAIGFHPAILDPCRDGVGRFSADLVLLPTTCRAVPPFGWSPFLREALAPLGAAASASARRVLFVSRGDVGNRRGLTNEAAIVGALREAGLPAEVVQAGLMSLDRQRALFAEAALVVGPHGSGLNNAIFAPAGCAVLELICDTVDQNRAWFHNLFVVLGRRYGAVNCPPSGATTWDAEFAADPALVVEAARALVTQALP